MDSKNNKTYTTKPLFSIVFLVYNGEETVSYALDSILSQDSNNFELIIVNDGSTDNTLNICEKFKRLHDNVRIISKENGGIVSARETGLLACKGDYVFYFDADDLVAPNVISKCEKIALQHPDIDLICFNYIQQTRFAYLFPKTKHKTGFYDLQNLTNQVFTKIVLQENIIPFPWRFAFKKEILLEHYCKDHTIKKYEDTCFTIETILNCKSMFIMNDRLYFYNAVSLASATNSQIDNITTISVLYKYLINRLDNKTDYNTFNKCLVYEQLAQVIAKHTCDVFMNYVRWRHFNNKNEEFDSVYHYKPLTLRELYKAIKQLTSNVNSKANDFYNSAKWAISHMNNKSERSRRRKNLPHYSFYSKHILIQYTKQRYMYILIWFRVRSLLINVFNLFRKNKIIF